MMFCHLKPEKLNFNFSNEQKRSIPGIIYAHRASHSIALKNYTHEDILNYYRKRNLIDPDRYKHIKQISIGDLTKNMEWIEEQIYNFPRI